MPACDSPGMPSISLLRQPDPHGHAKVSFVELFFDLVFVFAVTQLSHTLIGHFAHDGVTLGGALQTGFLMAAVWWVWIFTSWVTNWLDPERLPVRICLFAMVLAAAGPFVHDWPPVATSAFACAVLVALAAWERRSRAMCLAPDSGDRDDAPSIGA